MYEELRRLRQELEYLTSLESVWSSLAIEGRFDLISKLHQAENQTPGYGTIIVPKEGFSKNPHTHNLVLLWLQHNNINVLDTTAEIKALEQALKGSLP